MHLEEEGETVTSAERARRASLKTERERFGTRHSGSLSAAGYMDTTMESGIDKLDGTIQDDRQWQEIKDDIDIPSGHRVSE